MMEQLINYLLQFGQLNQQQIDLINRHATVKTTPKGTYYHQAGQIPREVIFLTQGVMRICYYTSAGDEITKYFLDEDHFIADMNSFSAGVPSSEYVQAITDCSYVVLTKRALEELSLTIVGWDAIIAKVTAKGMADKVNRLSAMLSANASERYRKFLSDFPQLANRIPLTYLASYLGVTQSSLSRIRRHI